ncbi:S8 family serine peptidase [Rheinheimera texasensis]|uniref:S8 family peptidase n=1 Tax=Rheinheimera texasensis TaxID=306205 RepID=UPI0032B1FD18
MKNLLIVFSTFACSMVAMAQTGDTTAVYAASLPETGGYLLQTTGPQGQTLRWYRQSHPQYILELTGPGLYPALHQQAAEQLQQQPVSIDAATQQQLMQNTAQALAMDPQVVASIRQQIEQEQQQVIAAVQQLKGAQVEQQFSQLGNLLLVSGSVTQAQLAAIPGVVKVWPEQAYQVTLTESVPKVKAPEVWAQKDAQNRDITGQGVKIAVLDTGIDYNHPALGGCLGASCKVILGKNTLVNSGDVTDVHGHGTHVAAIAAGKAEAGNGVAPGAKIIAVKVLNDSGYGYDSSIIAGLEYAVDPDGNPATDDGADVINMSLGGPGNAQSPISKAAEKAVQAGVTVVVAAGNSYDYLTIGSPAAAPSVITVANTQRDDRVNYSSSRGPLEGANYLKPEIAAPGTDIEAAKSGGGLTRKTGTSMAAPHVAGAAALLLQGRPALTPLQVKRYLMQSADLIHGNPAETGSGRLNIQSALAQVYTLNETTISLGRVPNDPSVFSGSRQITFNNPTAQSVTVSASVLRQFDGGLKVNFSQPVREVAANSSVTFEMSYTAQSNEIESPENTAGVAGFQLAFDVGAQRLLLPVWYEKYQALDVQTDGTLIELRFLDDNLGAQFYSSGFQTGVSESKQLRFRDSKNFKQIFARYWLPDPKNPYYAYVTGFSRVPMPALVNGSAKLDMKSTLLTEYHQVSDLTVNGEQIELKPGTSMSGVSLFHKQQQVIPVLYNMRWCGEYECNIKPSAFMIGGTYSADWQFEQSFRYDNLNVAVPETWFYSWQGPLGQGSQKSRIQFTDKNLLKFELIPDHSPVTGGGLSHIWPFTAKAGDVMRVYQSGPLLLAETAPQIKSSQNSYNLMANSGYFSASSSGTIVKWRLSDTGARVLVPAVDFNTKQLPLSSSMKIFSGVVTVSDNVKSLQVQQAPRNESEESHTPMMWHDQFLNMSYFPRHTDVSYKCEYAASRRWSDWMYGVWRVQSNTCSELSIQVDNDQTKLLRHAPMLQYSFKQDGEMPRLTNLALFNRKAQSDIVSRIDHRLNFDIWKPVDQSPVTSVEVDFRTDSGNWRTIYKKSAETGHTVGLPISAETRVADLRIKVVQANGNTMTQVIPEALTIGASAGGDNDVDSDGILNTADNDNDNDGIVDKDDALPFDPTESIDSDKDGIGNNADPDDDNDGTPDVNDAFPLDPMETTDTDKDGIGNNADPDDDNDGVADTADAFPLDPKETLDTDKDGIGNNADPDDDNDGVADTADAFPLDPKETLDTDKDGLGNNADPDDDNDGTPDVNDALPLDPTETLDTDKDGIGNNADTDDDNDGVADTADAFPLDPKETTDTDKDGIGNNSDADDDNDGVADTADAFPLDPKETLDTDKDGIGNNADPDDDNDGVADTADAFPLDPKETLDSDKDGIGNNADADDDNDGAADTADAFPLDPKETTDTDKDGIGNNADPDDDNDGVADSSDKYPLDATRSSDPVTPNAGSSGSGGGGAGLGGLLLGLPLLAWCRRHSQAIRKAA